MIVMIRAEEVIYGTDNTDTVKIAATPIIDFLAKFRLDVLEKTISDKNPPAILETPSARYGIHKYLFIESRDIFRYSLRNFGVQNIRK